MKLSSAQTLQTMSSALESLAHFIHCIDNTYEISEINTMSLAIQHLNDLLNFCPKKVAQNLDNLIYILEFFITQPNSSWLLDKAYFYDFLTLVINRYPKLANGKTQRVSKLFQIALEIVTQISSQVSESWMNPPDGFTIDSQEDVDSQTVSQIIGSINVFSVSIGFQATLAHLQPLFLEYIQKNDDWRYPFAALMVSSQITNEESAIQTLSLIIQWAISMTQHYHPKVKYAALELIGHFSEDLKADFQEAYYNTLIPITLKLLQNPIPRIVAHTFACMTNFFENCKQLWKIQSITSQLLNLIIHYIKTGNTWVKQTALSTVAALASTEDAFGSNLASIFQLCGDIISGCLGKTQYIQVLNQSIEIISILLTSQKKQYVQPYLSHFVTMIFSNQDSIGSSYLLQAWNRLCSAYQQFTGLQHIYKSLLQTAKHIFEQMNSDQECITSLKCLNITLNCFKSQAPLYAASTAAFAKEVFQTAGYQKTKDEALMLQIATITTRKPIAPQDNDRQRWLSQAFNAYQGIIKMIEEALEEPAYQPNQTEQIPCLFEAVFELIASFKQFCPGEKLVKIVQNLFQLVNLIEKACQDSTSKQDNQNDSSEDYESIESEYSSAQQDENENGLEEALEGVLEILKELAKASTDMDTKIKIYQIYKAQIQYSFQKGALIAYFGLSLAVDILSIFGHEQIQDQYPKIIEFYSYYVENPCPKIRNMAVFGFNNIFSKLPSSFFTEEYIQKVLQLLLKSLNAGFTSDQKDQNSKFLIKHCKDNVISALGSLLKNHGGAFTTILHQGIYQLWFSHLPLNQDKLQGDKQQQFLIQILHTYPALLINQAKQLLMICEIYAKFVMRRKEKQYNQIVEKTKQSLQMMGEWSLFKESASYLWTNLSESHKQTLTRMMA